MPKFIPGLELSRMFFEEAVQPILKSDFPQLKYSAGLIGWGSEVLGYDTSESSDHNWGPRLLLFLGESDHKKYQESISKVLSNKLPQVFRGFPTNFSKAREKSVRNMIYKKSGKVDHMVQIFTLRSFCEMRFGFDITKNLTRTDWLIMSQIRLLEVISGAVFHDDMGLSKLRNKLKYFPQDVWLYLLASQWSKISEEEAFVGRTGDVGDELGSQIVAARLVRELMRLCFLMEKKYITYTKWFGTAFQDLKSAKRLLPIFRKISLSKNWKEREKYLSAAYSIVAKMHNDLKITKPMVTKTTKYFGRPYLVIHADAFASNIREKIADKRLRRLELIGSIDQFIDSTPVSERVQSRKKLETVYQK